MHAKSSSEAARRDSVPALISVFFNFHPETAEENKSIYFHPRYELWQLRWVNCKSFS